MAAEAAAARRRNLDTMNRCKTTSHGNSSGRYYAMQITCISGRNTEVINEHSLQSDDLIDFMIGVMQQQQRHIGYA